MSATLARVPCTIVTGFNGVGNTARIGCIYLICSHSVYFDQTNSFRALCGIIPAKLKG